MLNISNYCISNCCRSRSLTVYRSYLLALLSAAGCSAAPRVFGDGELPRSDQHLTSARESGAAPQPDGGPRALEARAVVVLDGVYTIQAMRGSLRDDYLQDSKEITASPSGSPAADGHIYRVAGTVSFTAASGKVVASFDLYRDDAKLWISEAGYTHPPLTEGSYSLSGSMLLIKLWAAPPQQFEVRRLAKEAVGLVKVAGTAALSPLADVHELTLSQP